MLGKKTWCLRLSPDTISVIESIMLDVKLDLIKKQRASGRWSVSEDEVFREILKQHLKYLKHNNFEKYKDVAQQIKEANGIAFLQEMEIDMKREGGKR